MERVSRCGTDGWKRRVRWWEKQEARLLRAANAMALGLVGWGGRRRSERRAAEPRRRREEWGV